MTPDVEKVPNGTTRVADIHSHAAYDKKYDSNNFSPQDKQDNVADKEVGYVSTPNGSLLKHDSKTGAVTTIGKTLPDSNAPTSPKPPKLEVPSQVTGN